MIDRPAPAVESAAGLQVAPLPAAAPTPKNEPPIARPAGVLIGRGWWTTALAAAVLVAAGGLWLVYNDDLAYQSALRARTIDNESLQGQNMILQGQLTADQSTLSAAQAALAAAHAELAHPHLGIWTVAQSIQGPTYYLAAGVPDAFTYHVRLRSTGAMNVSIVSFDQFSAAVKCIENGAGTTNWCMHHSGAATSWLGVKSVNSDFHLAEGCAAYLMVITAPSRVTVTPNVSVTYNPASHVTGTCA
ncbi:MAG: hypothetical protein E6J18_14235 [Chloroflexi bacterium]|nr:MAG: hypothetical protein E6J18_14235 [Chloroflexota bacterium]